MTLNLDAGRKARQVPSPPTERVVAIMHLLAEDPQRTFSLAEISRSLDLSRATCHAVLATLARHRWVIRHEPSVGYSWGPAIAALTRTSERGCRPHMQALSDVVGAQVFLARRDGASLVVTESVGQFPEAPRIETGLRMPLVAPFGRDYIAWAGPVAIKNWLDGIEAPSVKLRRRLTEVLGQVRERGYVIERLSREYVRVYLALHALAADGEPDEITARLASAFADLTLVDYLADELGDTVHPIATISAPIRDTDGVVTRSVTAAPFRGLRAEEIDAMGSELRQVARLIEQNA